VTVKVLRKSVFIYRQAGLSKKRPKKPKAKCSGEIWFNFGGFKLNNPSVKLFKVTKLANGTLRLKATLVEIKNGLDPFDKKLSALCCGNHCSNGCYDISTPPD
jgi:hypothetical protein